MKKLILLLFIPLVSFGQTKFEYYESGAVQLTANYVDGKLQGEEIGYYESGAVQFTANYVDGIKQGEDIFYFPSGAVKSKYNYVDGKLQGEMIEYHTSRAYVLGYERATVERKINYVDGIKQGEDIFYFPSGAVKSKYNYVDGKLQGEMIKYYPNGEVEYKENYIDGLPQGEEINISFFSVENYPVYPGCKVTNAMIRKCFSEKISIFVQKNFNTDLAVDLGLTGRIRVWGSFKIDKRGNVIDVKARAPHPILEEEVQRVINLLPKMKPAKQGGKAVIVPFSLPITFEVAENTDNDAEVIIIRDM